jgi:hypothetical protein
MVEFGYINIIEPKPKSLSFIDGIISGIIKCYLDIEDVVEPNKVIFELGSGSGYSNSKVIELNSYVIDTKYDSLNLYCSFRSRTPLYMRISNIDTWYQINAQDKIVIPEYPIGTMIDPNTECEYSRQYKSGYSSDKFVFGIWKLKGSTRFLIGWDEEKISCDLLLYLLNWIFIKNNTYKPEPTYTYNQALPNLMHYSL